MPHRYPILLDLADARIVIIGGGKVASRKAAGVIEAGASDVTVVAPRIVGDFASGVKILRQAYSSDVLAGATLIFAATDRAEVNAQVVRDARSRGLLANRADADVEPAGDFVTPAKFAEGEVLVTVSAGSAALAAAIRDGLREKFDPRWSAMAVAMRTLRPWLRDRAGLSPEQRSRVFRTLATDEALDRLNNEGIEALRRWALESAQALP